MMFVFKRISIPSLVLATLVILLPVFDNLSGALFKLSIIGDGSLGSPSQLGRFAALLLIIWALYKAQFKGAILITLLISCYLLMIETSLSFFHTNLIAMLFGAVFASKIIFFVVCYLFTKNWIEQSSNSSNAYNKLIQSLIVYGTFVAVLVIVAYLTGFHIANYKIGIATRGLFISGNGLGIVLGVTSILLIQHKFRYSLRFALHLILLLVTTALLGTKASLIFTLISLILLTRKLFLHSPFLSIIVLFTLGYFLLLPLWNLVQAIFENIIYKFTNIDDKLTLIASSRDLFIKQAFEQINWSGFYSLRLLFGGGAYYGYLDFTLQQSIVRKYLENDLFELFFSYGIIPCIAYLALFFSCAYKAMRCNNWTILLATSLVFLHSITMGHVLFNGTSSITYAFCLALANTSIYNRNEI